MGKTMEKDPFPKVPTTHDPYGGSKQHLLSVLPSPARLHSGDIAK